MKTLKFSLILRLLLLVTTKLVASSQVLEPNERTPEHAQIWGAFTLTNFGLR